MVKLTDCFKGYTEDQDKVMTPADTVARVKAQLAEKADGVLGELKRIDTGRLGIPVFLSMYGPAAAAIAPSRKQMGKGASPEQAEASALMELVERYGFFTFFENDDNFEDLAWAEAKEKYGDKLIPISEIAKSVGEDLSAEATEELMNLLPWRFCEALHINSEEPLMVPVSWFKLLNEFNGSSAGNTLEESVFQGACELVERHVSAIADSEHPELPTIAPISCEDPILQRLLKCFTSNGVNVVLKDMTMGMPVPTVCAIAWDPETFPSLSEIVVTAGTASSPAKAAIRALTEVAQLAGDFHSGAVYEPSGMSKPQSIEEAQWLLNGPTVALDSLPSVETDNIKTEIESLAAGLEEHNLSLYTIQTTPAGLDVSTNFNFSPGMRFLERSKHASIGMFVGRKLAEECDPETATRGLMVIEKHYPEAHFLPFFEGLIALNAQDPQLAALKFEKALPLQKGDEDTALCAFYAAYASTQLGDFYHCIPFLDIACDKGPEVKEYFNLRGVCHFKQQEFRKAADNFETVLGIDKGSAVDLANLGLCHKFLGEKEEARRHLSAALEMDSSLEFAAEHLKEL